MTDHDAIASIIAQGDGLAERIFAVDVPDIGAYRALNGLAALARGSGLFIAPDRWEVALRRLPAAGDMAAWARQEDRLASVRG
jgi:hypothetical protein